MEVAGVDISPAEALQRASGSNEQLDSWGSVAECDLQTALAEVQKEQAVLLDVTETAAATTRAGCVTFL